jgi:hypothetical protein
MNEQTGMEILPALSVSNLPVPFVIAAAGDEATEHFLEFFAANIRNRNTRAAYVQTSRYQTPSVPSLRQGCDEIRLGLVWSQRL